MKYDIKTAYNQDTITLTHGWEGVGHDLLQQKTTEIINLKEQAVQAALNKLGWLSPEEAKELIEAAGGIRSWREGTEYYEDCEATFVRIAEDWYNRDKENN